MKPNVRLHECTHVHCTGCGAVRGQTSLLVSWCTCFLCLGRCGVPRSEGLVPPDPKGWTTAAAAPDTLADHLGVRAEAIQDTLFALRGSRLQWVVRPRTRVSCLLSPLLEA